MREHPFRNMMLRIANSFWSRGFYKRAIPILCYHSVPDQGSFRSQMTWLRDCGYRVMIMDELCDWMAHPVPLDRPAVVLTFDDCYTDQFQNAVPVLTAFGYPATFFAVTQWLKKRSHVESGPNIPKLPPMGQDEIRELWQLGFGVGCHGRTHTPLSVLAPEFQRVEIQSAKEELEEILREPVRFFCFPYGHYSSLAIEIVKSSGFKAAASVRVGAVHASDDPYTLKRLVIPSLPTQEQLMAQLTWIPQAAELVHKVPPLTKFARVIWKPR